MLGRKCQTPLMSNELLIFSHFQRGVDTPRAGKKTDILVDIFAKASMAVLHIFLLLPHLHTSIGNVECC